MRHPSWRADHIILSCQLFYFIIFCHLWAEVDHLAVVNGISRLVLFAFLLLLLLADLVFDLLLPLQVLPLLPHFLKLLLLFPLLDLLLELLPVGHFLNILFRQIIDGLGLDLCYFLPHSYVAEVPELGMVLDRRGLGQGLILPLSGEVGEGPEPVLLPFL